MSGRYAPSPTGPLHLGNLRTALVAWLLARSTGRSFRLRFEDLDAERVRAAGDVAAAQLADLESLGLDFDGEPLWQSSRLDAYARAAGALNGRVYECYCTRREIAQAASAPHGDGWRPYPGTCRNLTEAQRAAKRAVRPPALRVRADAAVQRVADLWAGEVEGVVDDFVIRRGDGAWAYNFAVVVDDIAQGVDQVTRGADLLASAPRQAWLTEQLGHPAPEYAHVPLVLNANGVRQQKRDGAVTLADLAASGVDVGRVRSLLACSLGLSAPGEPVTPAELLRRFDPAALPREPWRYP
jgi:glutamyl-tRNA synthetase